MIGTLIYKEIGANRIGISINRGGRRNRVSLAVTFFIISKSLRTFRGIVNVFFSFKIGHILREKSTHHMSVSAFCLITIS